jgi:hypothetical protein
MVLQPFLQLKFQYWEVCHNLISNKVVFVFFSPSFSTNSFKKIPRYEVVAEESWMARTQHLR